MPSHLYFSRSFPFFFLLLKWVPWRAEKCEKLTQTFHVHLRAVGKPWVAVHFICRSNRCIHLLVGYLAREHGQQPRTLSAARRWIASYASFATHDSKKCWKQGWKHNRNVSEFQDAEIRLQLEEYKFEFQKFLEIRCKLEINLVSFLDQLVRVGIL